MYCLVLESKTQCFYTNIFALNHFSTNKKKNKKYHQSGSSGRPEYMESFPISESHPATVLVACSKIYRQSQRQQRSIGTKIFH